MRLQARRAARSNSSTRRATRDTITARSTSITATSTPATTSASATASSTRPRARSCFRRRPRCSSSPTAMHRTIDRLLSYRPRRILQTHFGPVTDLERLAARPARRRRRIRAHRTLGMPRRPIAPHASRPTCSSCFDRRLDAHGYTGDRATRHALLDDDVRLNTQGLDVWLQAPASDGPTFIRAHRMRIAKRTSHEPHFALTASTVSTAASRRASTRSTLDDLTPGDVVVRVSYSDINYKDALAATGTSPILRKYPLAGGIDLAGEVVSSADPRYTPGQNVLVTGCGLSETQDGGYSEYSRLQGDWVIPLPAGMTRARRDEDSARPASRRRSRIHRMEQNGLTPAKGHGRRHRRDGRCRQSRDQHARRPRLRGGGGQRQARSRRLPARVSVRRRSCVGSRSTSARSRWKPCSGPARSTTSAATCSPG